MTPEGGWIYSGRSLWAAARQCAWCSARSDSGTIVCGGAEFRGLASGGLVSGSHLAPLREISPEAPFLVRNHALRGHFAKHWGALFLFNRAMFPTPRGVPVGECRPGVPNKRGPQEGASGGDFDFPKANHRRVKDTGMVSHKLLVGMGIGFIKLEFGRDLGQPVFFCGTTCCGLQRGIRPA